MNCIDCVVEVDFVCYVVYDFVLGIIWDVCRWYIVLMFGNCFIDYLFEGGFVV